MSIPTDVTVNLPANLSRRLIAHYEPPTYVCWSCKWDDEFWHKTGQRPCTCPPIDVNLQADVLEYDMDEGDMLLTQEELDDLDAYLYG